MWPHSITLRREPGRLGFFFSLRQPVPGFQCCPYAAEAKLGDADGPGLWAAAEAQGDAAALTLSKGRDGTLSCAHSEKATGEEPVERRGPFTWLL